MRHDVAGQAQDGDEIDVDDPCEIIVAGIGQPPRKPDPGVVDENIDTPEGVERGRRHLPASIQVGHVELQGDTSQL